MNKEVVPTEEDIKRLAPANDMLLTIGVFDGVHTGHRYLIAELVRLAKQPISILKRIEKEGQ